MAIHVLPGAGRLRERGGTGTSGRNNLATAIGPNCVGWSVSVWWWRPASRAERGSLGRMDRTGPKHV